MMWIGWLIVLACSVEAFRLHERVLSAVDRYINETECGKYSEDLIGVGSLAGFYSEEELWRIHSHLRSKYPKLVGDRESIGQTAQSREIHSFIVGSGIGSLVSN